MISKPEFSLKKKLIILMASIIVAVMTLVGLTSYLELTKINRDMYTSKSQQLSATAADTVDPVQVKHIRDAVMEIYQSTEDRVSTEEWGTPEFAAYLEKYQAVSETDDFKTLQHQLRIVQDNNDLQCACIFCFDLETESLIYLVDGEYENNCPPGCFDAVMYDVDYEAMEHPENGIAPDVTNTEEYGWRVDAGSPIFLDDELIAFAAVDISMNEVLTERNYFLVISLSVLLVLAVVFVIISIILIDRAIVRPIGKLSETSEKYWSGESSSIRHEFAQLQINTRDEIEVLSNSMKRMEQSINDNITQLVETTQTLMSAQEHAEEMDRAANIDALTKVRNRRAYDLEIERVDQEIKNGMTDVGLAMIDLNYLKVINDTYGHEKGNEALQLLCRTICHVFSHSPVFRVGGDEFVVVLENDDLKHLDKLKESFEQEMALLREEDKPWRNISAACGYALYDPQLDTNMDSVFKRADQLMYENKKQMKAVRN